MFTSEGSFALRSFSLLLLKWVCNRTPHIFIFCIIKFSFCAFLKHNSLFEGLKCRRRRFHNISSHTLPEWIILRRAIFSKLKPLRGRDCAHPPWRLIFLFENLQVERDVLDLAIVILSFGSYPHALMGRLSYLNWSLSWRVDLARSTFLSELAATVGFGRRRCLIFTCI